MSIIMKIYILKIALHGVSPMVWRRLKISGITSLATLHEVIQIVNGWDNDHLHRFHIYAVDYGISYVGGLSFRDNAHKVYLNDFKFDTDDKFFYEYNFNENLVVDIRIESIIEEENSASIVHCIKGNGMPCPNKHDKIEATFNFLKAIIKQKDTTTFGDIRPLVDELNAVKFNRNHINHCLETELAV